MPETRSTTTLRKGFTIAGAVAALAALAYAGLLGALYFNQERLIFPATALPADFQYRFDQPFDEIAVPVQGGTLDALLFRQPKPAGLVFYLHGNGGDLRTWTTGLAFYQRINFDLFIVDYRGYGKSTGSIESEAQLHADVRAAWDAIAPRYRGMPIVVLGRSLGTGLASAAMRSYPYAPQFLVKYPLRTDAVIGSVRSPMLLIAGTQDPLTPLADSEHLRSLARSPVELLVIDGAGHNDIQKFPSYVDGLATRLARIGAR